MGNRKLLNPELGRLSVEAFRSLPARGIAVVLDNIRSAHNVGSAFRTSDAFRADCVYLCGICAVPPSAEIHKTALGAEDSVPWNHFADTLDAVNLFSLLVHLVLVPASIGFFRRNRRLFVS